MMDAIIGIDPGLDGGIAIITKDAAFAYTIPVQTIPKAKGGQKRIIDVFELRRMLEPFMIGEVMGFIEDVHGGVFSSFKGKDGKKQKTCKLCGQKIGPKAGAVAGFNFGDSFGIVKGLLAGMDIKFQLVPPQRWKKVVLDGIRWKGNKKASVQYCMNRFPEINLKKSERCRIAHLGKADALCIAEYGRLRESK